MATVFRAAVPGELGSLDPSLFLAWIIERAGRAVGYLVLSYAGSAAEARRAYVSGLYLEPEARGKGLGPRALQFAGEVGRAFGLKIYSAGVANEDKQLAQSGMGRFSAASSGMAR